MRLVLAALLSGALPAAAQYRGTMPDLGRNPEIFPRVYKPYVSAKIPGIDLSNSPNLLQLIKDGKLQLSLIQLKAAVGENNLDIMSSRNSAFYAQTDMLRVKGGGAPRGGAGVQIPSGLYSGAIGAGVGGFGGLGSISTSGITGGARQVSGFARGSYDPSLAFGFSVDRTHSPLNSTIVSGVSDVATASTAVLSRYSQSFSIGSSISVAFHNMRQSSTQKFLLYNPAFVSQLSMSFTQNLLNGFGRSVGRRFIEVAKKEEEIIKENVRLQINTTMAQAQNMYWDLVAARDNVRVSEESLSVAERLLSDNRKKEEIGTASGLDVITAESEVAARQRDLVAAETTLQLREVELKNAMSKSLVEILGSVQIEPADPLPEPDPKDIPSVKDALAVALNNRSEVSQAEVNLSIQEIAIRYAKDIVKPTLLFFANYNSSGLYGDRVIQDPSGVNIVLPGGISQAMRQVRSWSWPEYAVGFSFSINLRNRAAEADNYRAKLEKQQTETSLQRLRNSIALEVRKAVIGLVQAKAQVEASRKAAQLSGEALKAEETRLLEGASIPYDVIRRQRDYRSARFAEVQARANYAKALVERDRVLGILEPRSN